MNEQDFRIDVLMIQLQGIMFEKINILRDAAVLFLFIFFIDEFLSL